MPEFPDTDRHPARQAARRGAGGGKGAIGEFGAMWRLAALSFQLAGEVGAALLLGWLLDRWLGTPGRWIAILGIAGVVIGLVHFVRSAILLYRRMDR